MEEQFSSLSHKLVLACFKPAVPQLHTCIIQSHYHALGTT